jgi:hypothetical protein
MSNSQNIEKNILKEIKTSGYPLEIKVTNILENHEWKVYNQPAYFDEEENKWRTVDIRATKLIEIKKSATSIRFILTLLIECKTNKIKNKDDKVEENPWVFYVRNKKQIPSWEDDFLAKLSFLKYFSFPEVKLENLKKLTYNLHNLRDSDIGLIAMEPFNKKISQIFEARQQIIKALKYHQKEIKKFQYLPHLSLSYLFTISYPLLVIDGKLYKFYNEEKLSETNFIQYLTEDNETFIIDVVKLEFLTEYIELINNEFENIKKNISEINFF